MEIVGESRLFGYDDMLNSDQSDGSVISLGIRIMVPFRAARLRPSITIRLCVLRLAIETTVLNLASLVYISFSEQSTFGIANFQPFRRIFYAQRFCAVNCPPVVKEFVARRFNP